MRNKAVETTSLKRLISGTAEGCVTLGVWYDCWRIRILDKPHKMVDAADEAVWRFRCISRPVKEPESDGGKLEWATQESWVRKRQDVERAG